MNTSLNEVKVNEDSMTLIEPNVAEIQSNKDNVEAVEAVETVLRPIEIIKTACCSAAWLLPSHPDVDNSKTYQELTVLKEKIYKSWRHILKQKFNRFCRRYHIKLYIKPNKLEDQYYKKLEECLSKYSTFGCFINKVFTDKIDEEIKKYSNKTVRDESQNKNKKVKRIK